VKVAIVGAGNVGTALTNAAIKAGHEVTITARSTESARSTAEKTGAHSIASTSDAVGGADIVILAVPYAALDEVVSDAGDALHGKIILDVTNPVAPDLSGRLTEGTSAAQEISDRVPDAQVFKAFNTLFASRMADPDVDGTPVDGFVAGPDGASKQTVLGFVESLGFRPIDAGPLPLAGALEDMALLNMGLNARQGLSWQSGWKLVGSLDKAA